MNVNILGNNSGKTTLLRNLKSFETALNLDQIIYSHTRITPSSESVIDLIFTSDKGKINQSEVINFGLSDHFITFCSKKIGKEKFNPRKSVKIRSMKNYSKELFIDKLKEVDWSDVTGSYVVDSSFENFKGLFLSVIDSLAPEKEFRLKQRTEPWFNSEISEAISERDNWLRLFKSLKVESFYIKYKYYRNRAQTLVANAKRNFFRDQIATNKDCPKKLWQMLKSLGMPSKKTKSAASSIWLTMDDGICFEESRVADSLNDLFTTIAHKLVKELPSGIGKFTSSFFTNFYKSVFCQST